MNLASLCRWFSSATCCTHLTCPCQHPQYAPRHLQATGPLDWAAADFFFETTRSRRWFGAPKPTLELTKPQACKFNQTNTGPPLARPDQRAKKKIRTRGKPQFVSSGTCTQKWQRRSSWSLSSHTVPLAGWSNDPAKKAAKAQRGLARLARGEREMLACPSWPPPLSRRHG